jgi:hypothetical protein
MIKLLNIIKEIILEANIVKVPKDILSKLDDIYNYIKGNLENLKNKAPKGYDNPFIPSNFNKLLKFKDLSGKDIEISIGLYNDEKDFGAGRMNTIDDIMLVNLAFFGDKEDFLDLGEHELVHAMDPKVRDQKLFGREYAKKGSEGTGSRFRLSKTGEKSPYEKSMEKYLKSPWEFDSFTAPLLNKLKRSKNRATDKGEFKNSINKLFSDIRNKSINDDILNDEELLRTAWFFSDREWTEENWPLVVYDFKNELEKIKTWSTKPTLYKRFLQRYANVVG